MGNEVWGVLDILTYLDERIARLENVTETYAMAGVDAKEYEGEFYSLCDLRMLKNEIMRHMESEVENE